MGQHLERPHLVLHHCHRDHDAAAILVRLLASIRRRLTILASRSLSILSVALLQLRPVLLHFTPVLRVKRRRRTRLQELDGDHQRRGSGIYSGGEGWAV